MHGQLLPAISCPKSAGTGSSFPAALIENVVSRMDGWMDTQSALWIPTYCVHMYCFGLTVWLKSHTKMRTYTLLEEYFGGELFPSLDFYQGYVKYILAHNLCYIFFLNVWFYLGCVSFCNILPIPYATGMYTPSRSGALVIENVLAINQQCIERCTFNTYCKYFGSKNLGKNLLHGFHLHWSNIWVAVSVPSLW